MNYQITDTERYRLEAVSEQLGLICGLLCLADAQLNVITTNELNAFLGARRKEIEIVLDVIDGNWVPEKTQSAKKTQPAMRKRDRIAAKA